MRVTYSVTYLELWRPIVGYEGLYEVSNGGRIRRSGPSARHAKHIGRLLRPAVASNGYLTVVLFKEGRGRTMCVHQAVIETFLGRRPTGYETNHVNGIKTDNDILNLEYLSPSAHRKYAYTIGQQRRPFGQLRHNGRWAKAS